MAEFASPNPTAVHKKRLPTPATTFFVGSNDDQLERAAARAARAAAIRRTVNFQSQPSDSDPYLNKQQILELFHNCIKLASENVINNNHQSPPCSSSEFVFFILFLLLLIYIFFNLCAEN